MAVTPTGRIARKNVRITFQKNETYSDKYKNRLQRWTDYFACFAYASTYAAEEDGDVVPMDDRRITFEVRYCPELAAIDSTGYRILFMEERYNIISVDLMNYQKRSIRFTCTKEKR